MSSSKPYSLTLASVLFGLWKVDRRSRYLISFVSVLQIGSRVRENIIISVFSEITILRSNIFPTQSLFEMYCRKQIFQKCVSVIVISISTVLSLFITFGHVILDEYGIPLVIINTILALNTYGRQRPHNSIFSWRRGN